MANEYQAAINFLQEEIDENLLAEVAYAKLHGTPADVVACQQRANSFFAAIALLRVQQS